MNEFKKTIKQKEAIKLLSGPAKHVCLYGGSVAMIEEVWKDIPGYEGKYQASNLGRIKSLSSKRFYYSKKGKPVEIKVVGKIKKMTIGNHGYFVVNLGLCGVHTVHSLVAKAFLTMDGIRNHVDHINSIRTDNRVENLQWVTQQENNLKQRYPRGSDKCNAILHERDVKHIRDEYFKAKPYSGMIRKLASGYGVTTGCITDITSYRSWKHVR